jgi:hypothetical protein
MKPTQEQLDQYDIDFKNFVNSIMNKRELLDRILKYANEYGIENTRNKFNKEFDESLSMDAPNRPGYYRANND